MLSQQFPKTATQHFWNDNTILVKPLVGIFESPCDFLANYDSAFYGTMAWHFCEALTAFCYTMTAFPHNHDSAFYDTRPWCAHLLRSIGTAQLAHDGPKL